MGLTADYSDVTYGYCGTYAGFFAAPWLGPCTRVGTPKGYGRK